jgi:hypothetical protein
MRVEAGSVPLITNKGQTFIGRAIRSRLDKGCNQALHILGIENRKAGVLVKDAIASLTIKMQVYPLASLRTLLKKETVMFLCMA